VKYLNLEQKALELLGLDERDDEMVEMVEILMVGERWMERRISSYRF